MVYTAKSAATGRAIQIHETGGRIARIDEASNSSDDLWVAPGLIDIQVNGFAGVDYNSPDTPLDEIARSIEVIKASGVTRFYPTVITGSNSNIRGSLANLARAKRELSTGPTMPGFHVEGPWISAVDGPRGATKSRTTSTPARRIQLHSIQARTYTCPQPHTHRDFRSPVCT